MKKLIAVLTICCPFLCGAQIVTASSGSDVTIKNGTDFYVDGLTLMPSADFTLSSITLSRNSSINNASANPYVSRVYKFSTTSNPFSGTIRINYIDAELNGLPENSLQVNVHNGSNWQNISSAGNDVVNDIVVSNAFLSTPLNEITLANISSPLPLQWYSFTAQKQNGGVLLKWSTAQEQKTKDFILLHSTNGTLWNNIGTVAANGNTSSLNKYSYVHTTPVEGINYYRLQQRDIDNNSSYSEVRTIQFNTGYQPFIILGNPVVNDQLLVQITSASILNLYGPNGKLLWSKHFVSGTQTINMNGYAKGVYWLKGKTKVDKIIVQ